MEALANVVILIHLAFFAFVVGAFAATILGTVRQKSWALNPWLRIPHFCAVWLVIAEDWLAIDCPLNSLETHLHQQAGQTALDATPGVHERLLHHTLTERALDVIYLSIGLILVALLWIARPRFR